MGVDFGTGYIDVQPQIDKAGAEASMKKDLGSSLSSAGKKMTSVGASMTAGLTLPIVAFGKSAVSAFQESSAVAADTRAVLKSTGGVAGVTAKQIGGLATKLSEKSAMDDEAIQSGLNMIATFKNIRNEAGQGNKIFSQTSSVLVDLATKMGSDPKNAAIQLGKALNDPVKGISALTRVGVTFDAQQTKTITKLEEGGKMAEAQKVILKELNSEFGGSAAAYKKSAAGQQAMVNVHLGNAMESLGKTITKVTQPAIAFIADALQKAVAWFTKLPGPIKTGIVVLLALVAAAGPVLIILGAIATAVGAITAPVLIVVGVIAALIAIGVLLATHWQQVMQVLAPAVDFLKGLFIPIWESLKKVWTESILPALKDLWAAVKALWPVLKVLLIVALAPIVVAFVALMKVLPIVIRVLGFLIRIVAAVIKVIAEAVGWVADKLGGAFESMWQTAQRIFDSLKRGFQTVKDVATGVWDAIKGAFDGVVQGIKNAWNATVGGFGFTIPTWIPGGLGGKEFRIPELAQGGIVRQPTLALLGERGAEAVVPLSALAGLSGRGSGRGQVITGSLTLTPDSQVLIRGIAHDEDEVQTRRVRTAARMNPQGRAVS